MRSNKSILAIAAISIGASALQAQFVYNNGVSYSGAYLNPGSQEVGDEVILGGVDRLLSHFTFEYYGLNFSGNEQYQIRFYYNNGAPIGGGYFEPGVSFFDSGLQTLGAPTDPSNRATYDLDLSGTGIILPNSFTWSIQFSGISGPEVAGVSLYNPPTTGFSDNDFWLNNAGAWELHGTNPTAFNFGATITAVPEPSTYVLAILGGICGFALVARRKNGRR
jgi:hypothetical protein